MNEIGVTNVGRPVQKQSNEIAVMNSRIFFAVLRELCCSCWQRSSESHPTAQDVANRPFEETDLCELNSRETRKRY